MTKIVQLSGGSRLTQDIYVGAERELTVDTSNWNLRLHDGVTEGGYTILNQDNSDGRYQAKSPELDGLTGFTPQQRGILVRLGPADYRLRVMPDTESIDVTNGDGYDGNFQIRLRATVTSDHTFSGDITFVEVVTASGGVLGNVVGNVTGDLTGNSTGTHTGPVNGNADGDHTGSFTGDVDTSSGSLLLGAGQVHLAWLNSDAVDFISNSGVPAGAVIAWYGDLNNIPSPWLLCDGTSGTPNLIDRFIIGAGGTYSVGQSAGTATHTHGVTVNSAGAHTHTITVDGHTLTVGQIPAHRHRSGVLGDGNDDQTHIYGTAAAGPTPRSMSSDSNDGVFNFYSETIGGGEPHPHNASSASNGDHVHSGSTAAANHLPPCIGLGYIMKGS